MRYLLALSLPFLVGSAFSQLTPSYNDILIPMRDNLNLEADVYIPSGVDSAQVILIQTPYNKDLFSFSLPLGVGLNLDAQPYIWVIVDWRGFYGSAPAATAQPNRGEDAYDVCEWIVAQSWHRDRIGTWGPSALGGIQYQLIRENHPNHTCAVPLVATGVQSYDSYFTGGVLEKARLEQLDALGYGLSPIVLSNPYYSNTWSYAESTTWYPAYIKIPTLQIGGWYDHNIDKMVDFYKDSRALADPSVLDEQWFLVGPWTHGGTGSASPGSIVQGELTYANAYGVSSSSALDFFDYYLRDVPNGWPSTPQFTYYETGKDQWANTSAASIEAATSNDLYLSAFGELVAGNASGFSTFVSDPSNPSPTIGGATLHPTLDQGPYDQSSLDARSDLRTFTSAVLPQDLSVSGRVKVTVHVESDQPDCDISVRLVDVYPDGRNMLITDGIARMRFRNGYTQADEEFMTPGVIYAREIVLPFTNYTWLSGHRLKIYVGGNNAIRYDVNLQNGGAMYAPGDTNSANITIHHNSSYPSRISLPGSNDFLGHSNLDALNAYIHPNPASETLFVESDFSLEKAEIYATNGKLVAEKVISGNSIDIRALESGLYLLRLSSGEKTHTSRFIKP